MAKVNHDSNGGKMGPMESSLCVTQEIELEAESIHGLC